MITPRWVETRSQPIALDDVVVYLTGVLGRAEAIGRSYEIGGPEVLTYRDLMSTVARILHRRLFVLPVPLLSPRLSSHWLRLVTDVDLTTARALGGLDDQRGRRARSQHRHVGAARTDAVRDGRDAARSTSSPRAARGGRSRHAYAAMTQSSTAQSAQRRRHAELLRRRRVSGATLIVGTLLLCATLRVPHGSTWFTVLGFLVAATWIGGALLSGPIRIRPAAPLAIGRVVGTAAAVAVLAYVVFVVAYLVAERLPVLSGALDSVLDKADAESTALVLVIALGERRRRGTLLPRCAVRCLSAACSRRRHDPRLRVGDRVHPQRRARGRRDRHGHDLRASSAAPPAASSHRWSPT